MKNTFSVTAAAVVIAAGVLASSVVHAQTKPIHPAPLPAREMDPAKRIPPPAVPVAPEAAAEQQVVPESAPTAQQPAQPVQPTQQAQPAQPVSPAAPHYVARPSWEDVRRGGFFAGVQGGRGWVYESVDQDAWSVNAGYRWQAGPVSLLGIELAAGKLDGTTHGQQQIPKVDYASIGFNGRFNFGSASPVYALVRSGYFSADQEGFGSVDGGYAGVGLGMDFGRRFNLSLVYTAYVYFNELYWNRDGFVYDANHADTLMLGAEVRF